MSKEVLKKFLYNDSCDTSENSDSVSLNNENNINYIFSIILKKK
jgi:hypothetical protein